MNVVHLRVAGDLDARQQEDALFTGVFHGIPLCAVHVDQLRGHHVVIGQREHAQPFDTRRRVNQLPGGIQAVGSRGMGVQICKLYHAFALPSPPNSRICRAAISRTA